MGLINSVASVERERFGIFTMCFSTINQRVNGEINLTDPDFRKTFNSCGDDGIIVLPTGAVAKVTYVDYTDSLSGVKRFPCKAFQMMGRPLELERTRTDIYGSIEKNS